MRIFFSVGEPSGDLHGANLVRDLRRRRGDVQCVGFGGPRMAAAGCELLEDLTSLAVMLLARALLNVHKFWNLLVRADHYFREHQVDAVVLIDYPGFNWWIARRAKKHNIPVFYYGVPQMWGWGSWRVRKMRRLVDHAICKLPFEEPWYRQRGCDAHFVGHPYFDEMAQQKLDQKFLDEQSDRCGPLLTILPGSRMQEVESNLGWFLNAAANVRHNVPNVRIAIASYNQKQAGVARTAIAREQLPAEVYVGRTPELIYLAKCCLACSGSVSLELLHHLKPTVIQYRITRLQWLAQALIRRSRYITLVNLLATDDIRSQGMRPFDPDAPGAELVPFPEYFTCVDKSDWTSSHIVRWLTDSAEYSRRVKQLADLKSRFGQAGASAAAAEYILSQLGQVLMPHHDSADSAA